MTRARTRNRIGIRNALTLVCLLGISLATLGCRNQPPRLLERPDVVPRTALALEDWEYRVGPGDLLRVNVFNRPELSSPILRDNMAASPVDGLGQVMLPLIGAVEVAGLTVQEIAARVTERLEPYLKEPAVDVAVAEHGAHRVLVLGEVQLPGAYPLSRPTTALEAIGLAGGLGGFANRRQVAWVRGTLQEASLVVFDASELDPLATQLVAPGDYLFVGRRNWADVGEAARELIPVLQAVSIPLSIAIQAATLEKID